MDIVMKIAMLVYEIRQRHPELRLCQILSNAAGKSSFQQSKILVSLIFGHHSGALLKFGDDILVFVDMATVDVCDIAAIAANMTANLADFLNIHNFLTKRFEIKCGNYAAFYISPTDISNFE